MVFSSKISIAGLGAPSLSEIPINRWTKENVKQWLSEEGLDKKVVKVFTKKNITGANLIDQNQSGLASLGVPEKYCEAIYHKIQQVKHRQVKTGILLPPSTGMTVVQKPTSSESNFGDRLTVSDASTEIIITSHDESGMESSPPKRKTSAINIANRQGDAEQDNSYFKKSTFDEIHSFLQEQDKAREINEPLTPEKKKPITEVVLDETKFKKEYLISDSDMKQLTSGKEQTVQEMEHEQKFILDLETGLLVLKASKKERCKDIPLWSNEFSEKQTEMYDYCYKKLEYLVPRIGEDKVSTIVQDLIFPERLRYKYFNPLKIQSAKRGSIFGEDPCILKVKLVIAEISDGTVHSRVRKFGASHAEASRQYGVYTTGLMFGPWYIAWDENSVAVVRNAPPKAAISINITTIKGKHNVGHLLGKLCSITSHYNYTKTFDFKTCNSQTYVESVISYLELKNEYEESIPKGPIRNLLGVIRKRGIAGMHYSIEHDEKMLLVSTDCNTDLKMEVLSKSSLTFSSHSDLDEFVLCINHANPEYFKTEPGLQNLQLLCLFDQSFSGSNVHPRDKSFSYKTPFGEEVKCPFRAFGFCKHQFETFQPKKGIDYDFYSLEWPQPVFKKK